MAATLFAGATVLATVGFGMGVVTMPVLLLVLSPQSAVVPMNTIAVGLEAWIALRSRASLPLREMLPVAAAGLLGVPIGVIVLGSADIVALRVGISLLVIVLALLSTITAQIALPAPRVIGPAVGFLVGLMVPSLGVGGPLVALVLLAQRWPRQAMRASMAFYLSVIGLVAVLGYGITGLFTTERVLIMLVAIAPVLAGLGLGTLLVGRMNERLFRGVVLAIIITTSATVLARELTRL